MNDTSYKSTISIGEIHAQILNRAFDFDIFLDYKSQPAFYVFLTSYSMNQIQSLTFRYMVIDSNWGGFVGAYYQESPGFIGSGTSISSTNPYSWTQTFVFSVNMTGTVKSYYCLTGFDVLASTGAN